eukprot:gene4261-773_t
MEHVYVAAGKPGDNADAIQLERSEADVCTEPEPEPLKHRTRGRGGKFMPKPNAPSQDEDVEPPDSDCLPSLGAARATRRPESPPVPQCVIEAPHNQDDDDRSSPTVSRSSSPARSSLSEEPDAEPVLTATSTLPPSLPALTEPSLCFLTDGETLQCSYPAGAYSSAAPHCDET